MSILEVSTYVWITGTGSVQSTEVRATLYVQTIDLCEQYSDVLVQVCSKFGQKLGQKFDQ